ncbi:MAG: Uma2 family endonuclease [Acidobacteria bacterium]|nr:MAG: Uma2 family endonuclease [Acidobacteriota bacterium]
MSRAAALREHDDTIDSDHIVVLHDVSWEDYERILEIRGEHSAPRISYLEGELEIMSPGQDHEIIKSRIGRLLEAWCMDRGIELEAVGSWTLKNKRKRGGAEADESYIFGTKKQSRPHLAIEVEWTHGGIDKLAIYEKLGVEEVWFWRKGALEVYILTDGKFTGTPRSRLFPELNLELLVSMLDRDTLTQAVRDFRKALRKK